MINVDQPQFPESKMVRLARFERATFGSGDRWSG
jgi:hypothetical protein